MHIKILQLKIHIKEKINFGIAGHPLLRLKPQALITLRKYLLKISYFSCCSIQTIYDTFSLLECSMVVDQATDYANQKLYSKKKKKKVTQSGNLVSKNTG